MTITESTHTYYPAEQRRADKWSWAQALWFITLSCGVFWAGMVMLLLRVL